MRTKHTLNLATHSRLRVTVKFRILYGLSALSILTGIVLFIVINSENSKHSHAETKGNNNWSGAISTDWNTPGNWSSGSVPNGDAVNIGNGAPRYPVITTTVPNVASITVNSSGALPALTVVAGGSVIASGKITFSGQSWLSVSGGSITSSGDFVVNGRTTCTGGTISTWNGAGAKFTNNGIFEMSGLGLLTTKDFDGTGLFANYNVTGGTIRITRNFIPVNFNATGGVVELVGTSNSQIVSTAASSEYKFYDLKINNTYASMPQITLANNIITQDTLKMISGIMNLASKTITLGASGVSSTLARTASTITNWVYGGTFKRYWLASTAITSTSVNYYGLFPVGAGKASSYRPVEINTTVDPTGAGYFTVRHIDATTFTDLSPYYNDAGTDIQRISNAPFITAISGVTGGTYNINVTMTGFAPGELSFMRLAVYKGGTTASAVGTHADATGTSQNPTVMRTGITTLTNFNNDFRISTTNKWWTNLPVEMISFSAALSDASVLLKWSTASETNNDYFSIERSADGETYTSIGIKDGAGSSNTTLYYEFTDTDPINGINFYRLKQFDFNGAFEYSNIIAVNMALSGSETGSVTAGPNPFNDEININYNYASDGLIEITLYDLSGKVVKTKLAQVSSGLNTFSVSDIRDLPAGIYMLGIYNGDKMTPLVKMVKSE